jgi:hypothetical protein
VTGPTSLYDNCESHTASDVQALSRRRDSVNDRQRERAHEENIGSDASTLEQRNVQAEEPLALRALTQWHVQGT